MPKYPSKPRRPLVSNLSTALLAWLLGAAPAAVAAQDSNIVPWRDHHAAFANGRDVFFLGGRKRAEGPAYTIPGNAADPNRSEWEADPSIFLLHANTTTSTLPAALPPLFGHSCATSDDGRFAYCTGGFRPNLPPYFGERNLYIFDLARRTVDQREMNVPLSGATWLPATRGLHATIFVDDELYLIVFVLLTNVHLWSSRDASIQCSQWRVIIHSGRWSQSTIRVRRRLCYKAPGWASVTHWRVRYVDIQNSFRSSMDF
ncbi:hypothetical protein BC832DRAFT_412110 [Gaertneriomyces semiglobifer]|nr:hypothetical protein BC832DRAFT_412110 [Gaertneriomyces semiglobifer]